MNLYYDSKMRSQRTRKINSLRFFYWLKSIPKKPWRILPILFLTLIFTLLWNHRQAFLPELDSPFVSTLLLYGVSVSIILLFLSLLLILFLLISYPLRARRYESIFLQINLTPTKGAPPALVAQMPIKNTKATRLVFYSLGVSMKDWIARQEEIEDALNVHYVEAPKYGGRKGNNRNLIILTIAPGVRNISRELLYDDEL